MRFIKVLVIAAGAGLLAACKQVPTLPGVSPYRLDIQQGNAVTDDMVSKLRRGMTRAQVRFVLGTPLVVDPFRTDRWDYVYVYDRRGQAPERRHITVIFEDDRLTRVDGDFKVDLDRPADEPKLGPEPAKPAADIPAAQAGTAQPERSKDAPPKDAPPEEKGFFGRMLEKIGF